MMREIRLMPIETQGQIFEVTDIFPAINVMAEIDFNYGSWLITVGPGQTANVGHFIALWTHYKNTTGAQLARLYEAITADYDPISNYDLTEQAADGRKLDKSKDTTTPYGGTQTTTKTYRAGLNSTGDGADADFVDQNSTPLTGAKTETEAQHDNTLSMSIDGTTHTGYHDATEHFLRRYGNVGVTTNAQMITGEIELRKYNLLQQYVRTFFDTYAFCVGGDD